MGSPFYNVVFIYLFLFFFLFFFLDMLQSTKYIPSLFFYGLSYNDKASTVRQNIRDGRRRLKKIKEIKRIENTTAYSRDDKNTTCVFTLFFFFFPPIKKRILFSFFFPPDRNNFHNTALKNNSDNCFVVEKGFVIFYILKVKSS